MLDGIKKALHRALTWAPGREYAEFAPVAQTQAHDVPDHGDLSELLRIVRNSE